MFKKNRLIGLLLLIALIMVLALAACGGDDDDDEEPTPTPTVEAVETEEVVEAEPTEEVAEAEPTEEVVEAEPTEEVVEAEPTEEVVEAEPTEEVVEAEPTEEVVEAEPTEEVVEAEPTEEVVEAEPTEEVVEAEPTEEVAEDTEQMPLRITLVVNGVLGDKSFFDSAQRGMDRLLADGYNLEVNTIELGIDPANWETGLADAMSQTDDYDMLIVGTYQMGEFLAARVHEYPDKYFVFYDDSVPYDNEDLCVEGCANVYSVTYAQNEGSFLAGVYAAAMSQSDLEGMNEDAILGTIGGQDIPVINDFIVGYEQGACLVNPATSVLVQYAGGWNDPAKGKEIALAMYEQKADIVFQVAGGTGVGVFEAAQEQGKYAIGVDSDQASIILETDPDQAERILTSMLKNVDNSLYRAVDLHLAGELPYGEAEVLGIAEGGVGLAINEIYEDATPDDVKALIAAVEEAVTNGDIVVISVLSEDAAEVGMACDAMPETDFDVAEYLE
jgi:basic membrane protein A